MFANQYPGGAELTTEALINSSNLKVFRLNSSDVTMELLGAGVEKYWIFTNFYAMNGELIPSIVANLRYSVVEYDFKYCIYRSPEKHESTTGSPCDCHDNMQGKMVSALIFGAESIFWMSDRQRDTYLNHFPFLEKRKNITLSSIFSEDTLRLISKLNSLTTEKSETYLVVGSNSWIKGVDEAVSYCKDNDLDYEVVSGISHTAMLEKMAASKVLYFSHLGEILVLEQS